VLTGSPDGITGPSTLRNTMMCSFGGTWQLVRVMPISTLHVP